MSSADTRKRILITGASGMLGSSLAWHLRRRWDVMGLYHEHPFALDGVRTQQVDVLAPESLAWAMRQFAPDVVIHCASLTNIDQCQSERDFADRVNVAGTRHVVRSMPEGARLVYISSDSVYDGSRGDYAETDRPNPRNVYGECKVRAEHEAQQAAGALVVRTNIFGWNVQSKQSLGEWMLAELTAGRRIKGFSDAVFSTVYALRLADLLEAAIDRGLSGIYNVGSRDALTKYEFAQRLAVRFGLDPRLVDRSSMDEVHLSAPRGKNLSMNVEKIERALGRPMPSIQDSIDDFFRDWEADLPGRLKSECRQALRSARVFAYGRQSLDDGDIDAVVQVLRSSYLTQGPRIGEFESSLTAATGARHGVAVNSGTAALHIACLAAGVGPGDEVITTPITFVASANCAAYCGARPVFADIDPRTFNLDPAQVEAKITSHTRAVVPVHFAGQSCDMTALRDVVDRAERRHGHKITIIEDACHALGSTYRGSAVGSCVYGDMAAMSFHPVKHVTTGEGGAVLCNDDNLVARLRKFRSHGITSDPAELINEDMAFEPDGAARQMNPWYYEQQELGFNYRITDLQCALGISQMHKLDAFRRRRRAIVDRYNEVFAGKAHIRTPWESPDCDTNFHLYILLFDFEAIGTTRGEIIRELRRRGLYTQVHYIPVHLQPYYRRHYGTGPGDCPHAEEYYRRCLSIPLFPGMTGDDVDRVVGEILELTGNSAGKES